MTEPVVWFVVCTLVAVPFFLAERGVELVPMIATIVGGLLAGATLLGVIEAAPSMKVRVVTHLVVTAAAVGVAMLLTRKDVGEAIGALPAPWNGLLFMPVLGSAFCAGWLAFTLLGRVPLSFVKDKPATAETALAARIVGAPDLPTPRFEVSRSGENTQWRVTVRAVPLPLARLGWIIALVVIVVGGLVAGILISLDQAGLPSSRWFIILLGFAIGMPIAAAVYAWFRRASQEHTISLTADRLRIVTQRTLIEVSLADLDYLEWRVGSDYARIVARDHESDTDISLMVGLTGSALPTLPQNLRRTLTGAGLEERSNTARGMRTYTRRQETPTRRIRTSA